MQDNFFFPECDSAVGQHLLENQDYVSTSNDRYLSMLATARLSLIQVTLGAKFIKSIMPEFVYALQLILYQL